MVKKHTVLIVLSSQFGYHTDTLMYCKYLDKSVFEIHYFGFDLGYEKYQLDNIQVHYIPSRKNRIIRNLIYLVALININYHNKFDLVFHIHTKFSLLIRLIFLKNKYIFDIRTGDLAEINLIKKLKNLNITFISSLSRNTSIISDGLADELHINHKKRHIIPLGGELAFVGPKDFSNLRLLYVGTLSKRNIHETIKGLALFLEKNSTANIVYEIAGSGSKSDIDKLIKIIKSSGLKDVVSFHGYIKYAELPPLFSRCNLGIVYIPQKEYYQYQPSTKLFEYMLSGMPVIATNTHENRLEVNSSCGIICEDNPMAFSIALENIFHNRMSFNSDIIKSLKITSTWENIVKENLEPYFKKVIST